MSVKRIAYDAMCVAMLIAVQFALSFVPGVELVTVLLLGFCYVFGVADGMAVATSFSLLRCFIFGFSPNVIVLYLIYYNLFALIFGVLGKHKMPIWLPFIPLAAVASACLYFAVAGVPVSVVYASRLRVMLWILFSLATALAVGYGVLLACKRGKEGRKVASVTAVAAFCTVCFTLLDDVITPLFLGYSLEAATVYFYNGFLAMIPQTVCATLTVFLLFAPLEKLLISLGGGRDRL